MTTPQRRLRHGQRPTEPLDWSDTASQSQAVPSELASRLRNMSTCYADHECPPIQAKMLRDAADEIDRLSHSAATGKVPTDAEIVDAVSDIFLSDYDSAAAYDIAVARAVLKLAASPAAPLAGKAEDMRKAICNAVVNCGHSIETAQVVLMRKPGSEGNALSQLLDRIMAVIQSAPLAAAVPAEEAKPCLMGEYACSNPAQCWEPCGQLGKSAGHAAPAEPAPIPPVEAKGLAKQFGYPPILPEPAPILASALTPDQIDDVAAHAAREVGGRFLDIPVTSLAKYTRAVAARLSKPTAQGTAHIIDKLESELELLVSIITQGGISEKVARDEIRKWANRHIAAQAPAGRDAIIEECAQRVEQRAANIGPVELIGEACHETATNVIANVAAAVRALKLPQPVSSHVAEQASGGAK